MAEIGIVEFLLSILENFLNDPYVFITVLFIYSVLTALFLPIPVEFALVPVVFNPGLLFVSALTLGAGKAVGSAAIFVVGLKVESTIRYWSARHRAVGQAVGYITRFVRVTKWIGLFVLLAIPFMSDTVPIYIYSLFNKQGQLIAAPMFVVVNFFAGVTRALVFLILIQLGMGQILGV